MTGVQTCALPILIARPQLAGKSGQPDNGGAAAGLTFSYQVLWNSQGRFGVLIRVTGKHRPRAWKLTFAMPGDEISDVMGADWHPSGTDGGTASGPSDASQWQWPSDGAVTTRHHRRAIGFLVLGQGTPVMPTGCSFNGASCTFS